MEGTCFYHHNETAVNQGYLTCTKPSHISQDSYRQCRDAVGELAEVRVMVSLHNSEIEKRSWEGEYSESTNRRLDSIWGRCQSLP